MKLKAYLVAIMVLFLVFAMPLGTSARGKGPSCAPIIHKVEQIRGLGFVNPPREVFLTPGQFRSKLRKGGSASFPKGYVATLKMLGMVPEYTDFEKLDSDLNVASTDGFYDSNTRKLYIPVSGHKLTPEGQSVCAHELTHALQDQWFDLNGLYPKGKAKTFDSDLSIQALVEGDATSVEDEYISEIPGLARKVGAEEKGKGPSSDTLFNTPTILLLPDSLEYDAGESFVNYLYSQGGNDEVNLAYYYPPTSSEQIIHPGKYLGQDTPVQVSMPSLGPNLGAGWHEQYEDTMGELEVTAFLTGPTLWRSRFDAARPQASGWGGDKYELYTKGTHHVLAWQTYWDTPEDAVQFEAGLRGELQKSFGAEISSGHVVVLVNNVRNAVAIQRSGNHVTYVQAPDRNTALRLLHIVAASSHPKRVPPGNATKLGAFEGIVHGLYYIGE